MKAADGASGEEWFTEATLPFASEDLRLSVRVTAQLYASRSAFNDIRILDTPLLGRVLVLDGIINIAEDTEFVYHELMVTLPCIRHGGPERVLIVGGGDGGPARHALGIATVQRVVNVEVDQEVVDACKAHLPKIGRGSFEDPRVELLIEDGRDFLRRNREEFDVIVVDVPDPVPGSPAEDLISVGFFGGLAEHLAEGGVLATHTGSLLLQPEKSKLVLETVAQVFGHVELHAAIVPEFQLTDYGFVVCSAREEPSEAEIRSRFGSLVSGEQRYLTADVYFSSQVLPPFVRDLIGSGAREPVRPGTA